jgi:5-methylcytosine-specific restriction protein A
MDLLAYWKWPNYVKDTRGVLAFHFNSKQSRLHSAIEPDQHLWLVSGRPDPQGRQYILVGRLKIDKKTKNAPGYKYGDYRVWGDKNASSYFAPDGPDMTDLLLRLRFEPYKPITTGMIIAQALQTIRGLSPEDSALLAAWEQRLALHPRIR